ncbi:SRPBCC family protein [Microbispora hainanensis]|uniref:SRPBCC domain-containing protein n=1 Tax=Microbispora hainanensis TaxID=568844 RepID=A0A544YL49_9ACTN|nr:SRPBCC family protein [Microbispora hainanensis]TQS17505.1 SRPBCC domain-containing protein [Microbispora hainanensis]
MTEPMIVRVRLAAPVKEVRHALTDAAAMRVWLAEHAESDLPGRYAFWGRRAPEGDAPHQRPLHADDHTLRFAWLLDGVETTTEITLTEETPDTTVLTLSQTHFDFQDVITGASIRGVLQTFWSMALSNLADYLEGREIGPQPDFTSADFRGETVIDAPVEQVFDSLIDSDKASDWFGFPVGIEPHVGGRFAMGGLDADPSPAKIIDLVPGKTMATDWGPAGVVTWELEDSGGKTRLTFVQSGFDTAKPPYAAWTGWLSGIAALRRYHEKPGSHRFWLPAEPAA